MRKAPTRLINWHHLALVFANQVSKRQITPDNINAFLVGVDNLIVVHKGIFIGGMVILKGEEETCLSNRK
jgi:hypothetical protein